MAKLLLVELNNSSQFFGKSEYAMFLAQTEGGEFVEIGITHNALERRQFDTQNLESLTGCTITTKVYTDNRTGEIVNPEDRIEQILNGEGRLLLLNSINSTISKSDSYKREARELQGLTAAKMKLEQEEIKREEKKKAALARILAKATAVLTPVASTTTDEPVTDEPVAEVAEEESEELGF